jgi:hypothetical protein
MSRPISPQPVAPSAAAPTTSSAPSAVSAVAAAAAAGAAQGEGTEAQSAPEPRTWREKIFGRLGKKSAGDFHPAAEAIRARGRAAAAPPDAAPPPAAAPASADASELAALRAELADLRAAVRYPAPNPMLPAPEPPAAAAPTKPTRPDPRTQPFEVAALDYLGDDAAPELVTRAAGALANLAAWQSQAKYATDERLKARAEREVRQLEEQVDSYRQTAAYQRELAELRGRLDRFEAPRVDVAAHKSALFSPERAPVLAEHFPRLAHALQAGAVSRAAIEARLDKLDATGEPKAWQAAAAGVLADLDELFPDPPAAAPAPVAQPAAVVPQNVAAIMPRQTGGSSAPREPAQDDGERRSRLKDRWLSLGPIDRTVPNGRN